MATFDGVDLAALVRGLPESLDRTREAMDRLTKSMGDAKGGGGGTETLGGAVVALNAAWEVGQKILGTFTGAIKVVAGAMAEWIQQYAALDQALDQLTFALQQQGKATDDSIAKAREFAGVIENLTGQGDDLTLRLQGQLASMGVWREGLDAATLAAIGLADATGQSVEGATRLVARTLNEGTQVLRRYGIQAKDAGDALDQLSRRGINVARTSTELSNQAAIAASNWGDLTRSLGEALERSTAVQVVVADLTFAVIDLSAWVQEHGPQVTGFFDTLGTVLTRPAEHVAKLAVGLQAIGLGGAAAALAGLAAGLEGLGAGDTDDDGTGIPRSVRNLERRQALEAEAENRRAEAIKALREQAEENERRRQAEANARQAAADERAEGDFLESAAKHLAARREQRAQARDEEYDSEIAAAIRLDDALRAQAQAQAAAEDQAFRESIARRQAYASEISAIGDSTLQGLAANVGATVGLLATDAPAKAAGDLGRKVVGTLASSAATLGGLIVSSGEAAKQFGNPYLAAAAGLALIALATAAQALVGRTTSSLGSQSGRTSFGGNRIGGGAGGARAGFGLPGVPSPTTATAAGRGGGQGTQGTQGGTINVYIGSGAIVGGDGYQVGRDLAAAIDNARARWRG